jgi:DNA-binding winged helix-turn-helix (wHTH) protein
MQTRQILSFRPYRLDLTASRLWRGKQEVKLTGKAFAVLRHLVTHAGELVTKDDLFQAAWPETVVSDAALVSCIKELRQALRDRAQERRYIETVHRRGFRFLGKAVSHQQSGVSGGELSGVRSPMSDVKNSHSALRTPHSTITLVGRTAELTQLHGWLTKALSGKRQVVFVTGEPGIGKTSLLEAFVAVVRDQEKNQKSKGKRQKFQIPNPRFQILGLGWRGASASNTMAQAKPICQFSRPWADCVGRQAVSSSLPC